LAHGLAHGGLGREYGLGRLRKTALADHLDQGAQRAQFHGYALLE
jgi:hypothetical protein